MSSFREQDESVNYDDSSDSVEALIRAAHGFVQVSDDLRPRVLETVRLQRSERRARRHIERLAAVAVVLAALATTLRPFSEPVPQFRAQSLEREAIFLADDSGWNLVDVFTEVRRRQAELFRPIVEQPARGT